MKRFKTKKSNHINIDIIFFIIILLTIIFIHYFNKNLSKRVVNITEARLDEISTLYVKKNIMPENIDLDSLIILNKNKNDEILYLDVDYNYAYKIMSTIVNNIQNNIFELEKGNISDISKLQSYKGNLYISVPLFLYDDALISNLGPKIPIKLSFYEHVLGAVNTNIVEYGINNALVNVTLTIEFYLKLNIPFKDKKIKKTYELTLGSKVINGKIPNVYGGVINNSKEIMVED